MDIRKCTYPSIYEEVFTATLSSGLKVKIVPRPGFAKSYALFLTHYGSNDSVFMVPGKSSPIEVPDGIAHFLEHQLFAKEWGDAFQRFSDWGANANAFTAWTYTGYLFSTTHNFMECLRFLIDFVQDPYFTEKGTEKEKGIIEQEIRMYDDDPNWKVYFNLLDALYQKHPVRKDIAGTVESVRKITKELLDDCYKTFYHPSNMVLVVVGDVDPAQVIAAADDELKRKGFREQGEIRRIYPEEPVEIGKPAVNQRLSVTIPLFALGFKDGKVGERGEKLLKKQITTELILQAVLGKSSVVYNDLYNEGLLGKRFGFSYTGHPDHGYTIIQGESRNPQAVKERILGAFKTAGDHGISDEDLTRSRKVLMGDFLRQMNMVEAVATSIAVNTFDDIDYLTYPDVLGMITSGDVNRRLIEHFSPDRTAFSTVTPI